MTPPPPRCVCVESPLRGSDDATVARNVMFADACVLDSLRRGEAPFLGHLIYPRVLNDRLPLDREQGIAGHIAWLRKSDLLVVYTDLGITEGMTKAITLAHAIRLTVEYRALGTEWRERFLAEAHATDGFFA